MIAKEAETSKQKNTHMFWKDIVDRLPGGLGVCYVYLDGRVELEYLNDTFYIMLHTTREECAAYDGFETFDAVQPDDRKLLIAHLQAAVSEQADVDLDIRVMMRDYPYHWMNVRGTVAERMSDKTAMYLLFTDVNAAHQACIVAEESNNALRIASRSGDMALWVYNLDLQLITQLFANGKSLEDSNKANCKPEEFVQIGKIFRDDAEAFLKLYDEINAGALVSECNVRILNNIYKKYEWYHMVLNRQVNEGVAGNTAIGFASNVELQMEAEIRYERENRLRQELVKDAVIYYRINLNNHLVEEMYSEAMDTSNIVLPISLEKLISDGLLDGCYEPDRPLLATMFDADHMLKNYESGKRGESFSYRRYLPGKGLCWLKASVAKLKRVNTDEVIAFFTAMNVDNEKKDQILYRDVMNEEIEGLMTMKVSTGQFRVLKENRKIYSGGIPVQELECFTMDDEFRKGLFADMLKEEIPAAAEFIQIARVMKQLEAQSVLQHTYCTQTIEGTIRRKKVRIFYLDESHEDIIFVRRDITDLYNEQQRQNAVLKRAMDETKAANEAKSAFLSRMSHDMRTPLNAIIGYAGSTLRDGASEAQKDEFLDDIYVSGEYLLGIINDVLDMSKIESNKMVLHPEPYTFTAFKDNVETVILPLCQKKGIRFEIQMPERDDIIVMTDRIRFNQIFINILSNAVKFTPKGGTVRMTVQNVGHTAHTIDLIFFVSDTGCGMSEEFLPHAFDSFSQEYTGQAMHKEQGTGLGLSIVKQLVELMGGTISVKSTLGEGSTFQVKLSLQLADGDSMQAKSALPEDALQGLHILLCEDHPMNRKIAARLLEKRGCIVEIAEDGIQGVSRFRSSELYHYDAIFMDIRMPNMDGLEAARTIRACSREDASEIPMIAMTANAFAEDRRESMDAGMNAHISKPINPEDMYQTLYQLTSARHVTRSPKILVVDDVEMNAAIIARVLQEEFETIVALSGEEALKQLAENPYIVAVITDVQMPNIDGGELIRTIRHNSAYNGVAIIANTQFGDSHMEEEMMRDGADDFIYKPTAPSVILSRVKNVLGKYR